MAWVQDDIGRKLRILNYAREVGNVSEACRHFGISREIFYRWRRAYERHGEEALVNRKPRPESPSVRFPAAVEEKILYLRNTYQLGQRRIVRLLERFHDTKVSTGGVYKVFKRHGVNRLQG